MLDLVHAVAKVKYFAQTQGGFQGIPMMLSVKNRSVHLRQVMRHCVSRLKLLDFAWIFFPSLRIIYVSFFHLICALAL